MAKAPSPTSGEGACCGPAGGSGRHRCGDPHGPAVGLDDLGDDGVGHRAPLVVPGEGVAGARVALQRPALVVVRTTTAEGVSRVHGATVGRPAPPPTANLPILYHFGAAPRPDRPEC